MNHYSDLVDYLAYWAFAIASLAGMLWYWVDVSVPWLRPFQN